ncbi:glycosyltransferase [Phytomonospora endophytica]|uniref:Vancomycin aglycone glucosyltransferase n=1 Tax=Phytomonospora endophytica TaxID=714109 RepID=A0A841FJP7_9ACTN|nr:glycosyltransferase [Phytomonospora endophytica]MBB6036104.1 vancomycin aglycone glucosyltransferase [Phytomonospora endophytica]GIG67007.1 glycosyl transferase [Phytomonospora endophytica]
MRILLSTYGSRGDVEPLVALALRLQAHGASVSLAAPPDFAGLLGEASVPHVPVGWPIQALATGSLPDAPKGLPELAPRLVAMAYEAVVSAGDLDLVLGTGSLPAAAGAQAGAEKLGVPFVSTTFSPCYLPTPHNPPIGWPGLVFPEGERDNRVLWRLLAEYLHGMLGAPINAHRESVGLPAVDNVRDHVFGPSPWLAADPVLGPWPLPSELAVVQTGAWIRPDERALPADLLAFLDSGEPPVYVGFGSMPMRAATEPARVAVESARAVGRRVVLSGGWAELVPVDDGGDSFAVGEVNQQALFPRVAAVVHHGGAGTTTTVARAGTPQVIVPQVADQPYWGARVTALGTGVLHDGPAPTAESLTAALHTVLEPGVGARAGEVAREVRGDGAELAARLLLEGQ